MITYDIAAESYEDPGAILEQLKVSDKVLFWLMDVHEDGVIDAADAFAIQRYAHTGNWPKADA